VAGWPGPTRIGRRRGCADTKRDRPNVACPI
jgi:hypothetical protein